MTTPCNNYCKDFSRVYPSIVVGKNDFVLFVDCFLSDRVVYLKNWGELHASDLLLCLASCIEADPFPRFAQHR